MVYYLSFYEYHSEWGFARTEHTARPSLDPSLVRVRLAGCAFFDQKAFGPIAVVDSFHNHPSASFPVMATSASSHGASSGSGNSSIIGQHFRVGKKIGEGSFGVVFEGQFVVPFAPQLDGTRSSYSSRRCCRLQTLKLDTGVNLLNGQLVAIKFVRLQSATRPGSAILLTSRV